MMNIPNKKVLISLNFQLNPHVGLSEFLLLSVALFMSNNMINCVLEVIQQPKNNERSSLVSIERKSRFVGWVNHTYLLRENKCFHLLQIQITVNFSVEREVYFSSYSTIYNIHILKVELNLYSVELFIKLFLLTIRMELDDRVWICIFHINMVGYSNFIENGHELYFFLHFNSAKEETRI